MSRGAYLWRVWTIDLYNGHPKRIMHFYMIFYLVFFRRSIILRLLAPREALFGVAFVLFRTASFQLFDLGECYGLVVFCAWFVTSFNGLIASLGWLFRDHDLKRNWVDVISSGWSFSKPSRKDRAMTYSSRPWSSNILRFLHRNVFAVLENKWCFFTEEWDLDRWISDALVEQSIFCG